MKITAPSFVNSSVVVIGDLMLDRYWHGDTSRISPEAPVPVTKVQQIEDRPGGAGNVALNIAALGGHAQLFGVTGKDEAAKAITDSLRSASVQCQFVASDFVPTITKLRVLSQNQQLIRVDFEEPIPQSDVEQLTQPFCQSLGNVGAVVFSDYGKGTLTDPQPLINAAKKAGVPVLVDPKGRDFSKYQGATLITPNLSEFEAVVGACLDEQQLAEKGHQLMNHLALQALLITRSEKGMTLLQVDQPPLHLPAHAREVFDVTGAGDTVIATLATALASGKPLSESVALANLAASLVVAKLGTATISQPELLAALSADEFTQRGSLSREQLSQVVADARARGEKVVFTNGCFDILHAGHVGYLEQARSLGDRLIVAVNTDDSVKRLKGEGRPINPVERRKTVLAGLTAVDWVTEFGEDTPAELIHELKPDLLVKGGDYAIEDVVGHDFIKAWGGQARVLKLVEGCSTTRIVEQIREQD